MIQTITKVLIANRGEIACRIIRTLDKMGIESAAVYSDADRDSLHVELATHAVHIGPSAAVESYLMVDRIIDAAKKTGANAIHPGYGFLSENPLLAEACEQSGIIFIGPTPSAIRAMGSKSAAKRIMELSGVPLIPGYHGDDQGDETLRHEAIRIGFPVILKAALGGGGKGMRTVHQLEDFDGALASCRREAQSAFNDTTILIEKYIEQPRHVEIQVFCDTYGNGVHLFERDCSVQRRHQKIIEEAPAPAIPDDIREKMAQAALLAAKAINYVGAGTVEFLYDGKGQYYFMEMNTRLQVEHPVTEMITGLDLVQWQVDIASGKRLPKAQDDITRNGHSIEARICAEDGDNNFMPSVGPIFLATVPVLDSSVRFDAGIKQADNISVFYDPMFAKLIVWGRDRDEAIQKMRRALGSLRIAGVKSNIAYLQGIFQSKAFSAIELTTHFLAHHTHSTPNESKHQEAAIAAAAYSVLSQDTPASLGRINVDYGWRLNSVHTERFLLECNEQSFDLTVRKENQFLAVTMGEREWKVSARKENKCIQLSGLSAERWHFHPQEEGLYLFEGSNRYLVTQKKADIGSSETDGHTRHTSPMPGIVTKLFVAAGDKVSVGDPLVVVEAMKMEHVICAKSEGIVGSLAHRVGDSVLGGVELVDICKQVGES